MKANLHAVFLRFLNYMFLWSANIVIYLIDGKIKL